MQLSARNQIPARVTSINSGEATANGHAGRERRPAGWPPSRSRRPRNSGWPRAKQVIAVVKASDVIVAIPD